MKSNFQVAMIRCFHYMKGNRACGRQYMDLIGLKKATY